MKSIFIIPFVILANSTFCQQDTTWYNNKWQTCKKEQASFYRPQPQLTDSGFWVKAYYLSGKLAYECLSQNLETDDWVNKAVWYSENGKLLAEQQFRKIIKEGELRTYYNNDQSLKTISTFKNWRLNGKIYTYYLDNKLAAEISCKDNFLHGSYISYYHNGAVKIKSFFNNNLSDSIYELYDETGRLEYRRFFSNGVPIGNLILVDKQGDTTICLQFVNGLENGYRFEKKINGDTSLYFKVKDGFIDGKYVSNSAWNSNLIDVGLFNKGKMLSWKRTSDGKTVVTGHATSNDTSLWHFYFDNEDCEWANGEIIDEQPYGKWNFYDKSGKLIVSYQIMTFKSNISSYHPQYFDRSLLKLNFPPIFDQFYSYNQLKYEFLFDLDFSAIVTAYDERGNTLYTGKILNGYAVGKWKYKLENGKINLVNFKDIPNSNNISTVINIIFGKPKNSSKGYSDIHKTNYVPTASVVITELKQGKHIKYLFEAGSMIKELCAKNEELQELLISKIKRKMGYKFKEDMRNTILEELAPYTSLEIIEETYKNKELMVSLPVLLKD